MDDAGADDTGGSDCMQDGSCDDDGAGADSDEDFLFPKNISLLDETENALKQFSIGMHTIHYNGVQF